jgi:hypothetical protein
MKKFNLINLSKISSTPSVNLLPYVLLTLSFVNKNSFVGDGLTHKPGVKIYFSFGWLIWDFQISNI